LLPEPPDDDDRWTIGRLLTWTTDYLRGKRSESPRLDAEVLLAHVLGCSRVQLYTRYGEEPDATRRTAFRDLVRRRSAGEPVAYLVGRKEFYALTLRVSPAVLIPRPDTETLVAEFLTRFKSRETARVLELGTGSGAIALACASQHRSAQIVATDLSPEALGVARENARTLSLAERIDFRLGSLYEPVAEEPPFDAILSNPPYIPSGEIAQLEPGVRDHEPHLALDGGFDGLEVVRKIVAGAAERLTPAGALILEIGTAQEEPVRALIAAEPMLALEPTVRDAAHHPRVLVAVRRSGRGTG
jgi:release factor glutamine methyltransferase